MIKAWHAILVIYVNLINFNYFPMQLTSVKTLNGTNYEDWVESLKLYLAVTNLDLALCKEEPVINENSTPIQRAHHEKWTHSNRVCLMVMKYIMEKIIR